MRWLLVIAITCVGLVSAAITPAQSATVTTNKTDYVPGEIVFVSGSGWQPGETVTLVFTENDQTACGPFTFSAIADANGDIANQEFAPHQHHVGKTLTLTATGGSSGLTASVVFTDAAANIDQGKNEKASAPVDPVQWVNGNLNENQSHYIQTMSVPYRMVMTGLTVGGTHTLVIGWDTRDNGLAAMDYLTHFQRLEPHSQFLPAHTAETVNPLLGLSGTFSAPTTYPIPVPSTAGTPLAGMPASSFNALPPGERVLTIYNGTITSAVYNLEESLALAHSQSEMTITFTPTATTAVIAWGGHIAGNQATEWNGLALPGGSPYHMRNISLDGSGGNQDRSLKAGAVLQCEIEGPSPVCPGTTNQYCVQHNIAGNVTIGWSFTANTSGASFVGATNGACVDVASGTGGSYTLKASVLGADGGVICEHSFTVNSAPVCSITGPDGPVCPSTTQQFCGPDGMAGYSWTVNGATIPGVANQQCVNVQAPAGCNTSYTVSLTVTDGQSCPSTCEKTINVVDTTAPVLAGVPTGGDLGCNPTLPSCATATATDNCDSSPTVNCVPGAITGAGCAKSQIFTYTATDDCGNSAVQTATYTWKEDTTAPVLAGVPAGGDLGCNPTLPSCGNVTANDACDGPVNVNCVPGAITGEGCAKSQTFTYSAVDACGNSTSASATFTWKEDTTNPVLAGVPAGGDLGCNPVLPSCAAVTASDNCDGDLGAAACVPGAITGEGCFKSQTFTYSATDACGNSASSSATFTWTEDTTGPALTCPPNRLLECGEPTGPGHTGEATATDPCGSASVSFDDAPLPPNCTGLPGISRTWTATDDCGNTSTCVQTIEFQDLTPPNIQCPPDVTVECNTPYDPSVTGSPTSSDNCGGEILVDFDDAGLTAPDVNCAGAPIQRTWTVEDACGNTNSCVQIISFRDTGLPTIQCPPNKLLECGEPTNPGHTGEATGSDACSQVTITFDDAPIPPNCTGLPGISRTWKATDACGNTATCVQTIEFQDQTPPNVVCPPNVTVECNTPYDPSVTGSPTYSDNCGGEILVDFDDAGLTPPDVNCAGAPIRRTWTFTDACGNTATCDQIISFQDSNPPTIQCPPNKLLECGEPTNPGHTGEATGSDACSQVTITFDDAPIPPSCTGLPGISRTWKATDACGNTATCVQSIEFQDQTPPNVVCPPNVTVECNTPYDPSVTGSPTYSDNCGGEILVDFDDGGLTQPDVNCAGAPIRRTWTFTDACGNTATCDQIISFQDSNAPTIQCPTDILVGACENSPTFTATGQDDCDATPTVVCVPPSGSSFDVGTTQVTCTATDDCGNSASCSFDVEVVDLPNCTISGASEICEGATTELCGPDGAASYSWSGPGGFGSTEQCITVGTEGTYSLETTDAQGCKRTCEHGLTVSDKPVCGITGPSEACTGESVELCGPDGNYSYAWTGPNSFQATSQCVTVDDQGQYNLVITDLDTKCASDACSHTLTVAPCTANCPRTAGFWSAQCEQSGTGSQKFNLAQMTQIAGCVDDKVGIFTWGNADFSGFCSAVSNGGQMNQRRQAKRQFAALLANVCTGELGLVASNGDLIKLDLTTPVSCSGLSATTIGGLITEVDGLLLTLEAQSLSSPALKTMYSQIIACLDAINNAENVGSVACTSAAAENAAYRDYQTPGDGGLTDVVELYRPSPNPFAHTTRIAYVVRGAGEQVDIGVFDLAGRKIRTLAQGFQSAGRYEVMWDGATEEGARVNNGVYFVRSTVAGQHQAMRVVYVK